MGGSRVKAPYVGVTKMLPVDKSLYPDAPFDESEQVVAEIPARLGRNGWFLDGPIPNVDGALSIIPFIPEHDPGSGNVLDVFEGVLHHAGQRVTLDDLRQMEARGILAKVCFKVGR